jgi:hypothetical protein
MSKIGIIQICDAVVALTDIDFDEMETMIQGQEGYTHPLKCGTAKKLHETGSHNRRVLNALKNFKNVIEGKEEE